MRRFHPIRIILCALLWGQSWLPIAQAQTPDPRDPAAELLSTMTVEEKIGQLFIVPFVGDSVSAGSDIFTLLTEYKIGGVVLQSSNSNFINAADTPRNITRLTNQLQAQTLANKNIPLFIAVDHEGDGYPYNRITGGVTPIPSPMTIGATWNPDNARAVGQIAGQELSAMGINLLLGPVLDVLNNPHPAGRGDMGTRTFGGDPFWVGEMGQAYIEGIHTGSNGRIATVAKHFPGHGGSDRLPDNEVATVDKSLQELKRIELAPFFAVTESNNSAAVTDAMMSSHIRYRGFQGDIRQFTAPISFDKTGMATLLSLPEFSQWRDNGGIIISDALGVPAVRKFYDPTLQTFPHRRIARDAFLAGNDVLILAQFDLDNIWAQQFENIKDTVSFFQSEYRKDSTFAERVDESVTRILRLKLKLFPNPEPNALTNDPDVALAVSGHSERVVDDLARQSETLLYPSPEEFTQRLPQPPGNADKILVVSDSRMVRECFTDDCAPFEPLPHDALQNIILELYGPDTTGQILPENIDSITFSELKQVVVGSLALATADGESSANTMDHSPDDVTALIQQADWIIFAAQDLNVDRYPDSDALKLFLAQGVNSLYNKKLIVLALNAPYFLDTTEISKLTAYLGLYSKSSPQLKIAARTIFGELTPQGAPPVSVDGIGYDLAEALSPDPSHPFALTSITDENTVSHITAKLTAGPIFDHNGNIVPDGTPVQFVAIYSDGQSLTTPITDTVDGMATTELTLSRPGRVDITAYSGDAKSADSITFNISPPTATRSAATSVPEATATDAPTATPVPATPTPTPQATATDSPLSPPNSGTTTGSTPRTRALAPLDFLVALGAILFAVAGGLAWKRRSATLDILRWTFGAIIGAMLVYISVGMDWLPIIDWIRFENASQWLHVIFWGIESVVATIAAVLVSVSGKITRQM